MSKNLYMHTIDGKPAYFEDNGIWFLMSWNRLKTSDVFVDSLEKIKRQQKKDMDWRKANGYNYDHKLGYIRIRDDR